MEVVHPRVLLRSAVSPARRRPSAPCARALPAAAAPLSAPVARCASRSGPRRSIADLGRPSRFANMLRVVPADVADEHGLVAARRVRAGSRRGRGAARQRSPIQPASWPASPASRSRATRACSWPRRRCPRGRRPARRCRVLFTASGVAGAASLLALGRPRRRRGRGAAPIRASPARRASWRPPPPSSARSARSRPSPGRTRKDGRVRCGELAHALTASACLLSLPRQRARRREQLARADRSRGVAARQGGGDGGRQGLRRRPAGHVPPAADARNSTGITARSSLSATWQSSV